MNYRLKKFGSILIEILILAIFLFTVCVPPPPRGAQLEVQPR